MNGIIIVNKEKNMTSHDVVFKIRKIFKTKKVGHLGTLDPLATGVLAVCINDATKLVQFLQEHDKTYRATVCLGKSSETYDLEGAITKVEKVSQIDEKLLDEVLNAFLGESMQLPPLYSSIKVNGKKLYEYARNNESVEIKPRKIKIYSIKRTSDIKYVDDCAYFDIDVHVSKGTYIRSLCYDIGEKLCLPSLMANLVRTSSDIFTLDDANTLSEIESGNYKLFSMLEALSGYLKTDDINFITKAMNGMKISKKDVFNKFNIEPEMFCIHSGNKLVAIYELSVDKVYYKAARVWN